MKKFNLKQRRATIERNITRLSARRKSLRLRLYELRKTLNILSREIYLLELEQKYLDETGNSTKWCETVRSTYVDGLEESLTPQLIAAAKLATPNTKWFDLPISVRLRKVLPNPDLTLWQVAARTERDLLRHRNLGRKSANEIKAVLKLAGLSLLGDKSFHFNKQ